jgi:hypothetical protein
MDAARRVSVTQIVQPEPQDGRARDRSRREYQHDQGGSAPPSANDVDVEFVATAQALGVMP